MRTHSLILVTLVAGALAAPALVAVTAPATTIAGVQDTGGDGGDGGPAVAALLNFPVGVAVTASGDVLIADQDNHRVRGVAPDGTITTVAGTGEAGSAGDRGAAVAAQLDAPAALAPLAGGGFLIVDAVASRVRRVSPDGLITSVAGSGAFGFSGDGGQATDATLDRPQGVAAMPGGGFVVADTFNNRIRRVDADGTIRTIAGTGEPGDAGDGGPALAAELNLPTGVAVAPDGAVLIADQGNHRIRRVDTDGVMTSVAGTTPGFSGDGGPAIAAELSAPAAVATLPDGGFLVADQDNNRIRKVDGAGVITSIGDPETAGGLALTLPASVAVTASGDAVVADSASHRVLRIASTPPVFAATEAARPAPGVALTVLRTWRAGRTVRVRVHLNQAARVSLWVRPAGRAGRVVTSRDARAGNVTLTWSGRVGALMTRPGRYRMVVAATAGGQRVQSRIRPAP